MATARAHVLISGRVQAVNFRESTRQKAELLGITGWVRNTADGRVEAVFEGQEPDLHRMVDWCRLGPPRARVDQVQVEWQAATGEFDRFAVEREWYW